MHSHITRRAGVALSGLALVGLAACSGSGTSPQGVTQANIAANVLQLAVGTANIYGDLTSTGGNLTGTNIVATYRQPAGQFAGDSVLVNSPILTGPFKLAGPAGAAGGDPLSTIQTGPAASELGGDAITSSAQGFTGTTLSSLGTSGGVSGLGIEPFNYNSVNGVPFTVVPYAVPVYDPIAADANAFIPWGGPPAFDPNKDGEGVRDGNVYPGGTLGISEGLDVFAGLAPSTAGAYTLSAPSTGTSAGTVAPQPATFKLKSLALLAAITPPVPTIDALGGATFAVTLPAGVTEAYVQVTDLADPTLPAGALTCNGAAYPVYYTLFVTASGTTTLGDVSGPSGAPSICTSAQNTAANTTANGGTGATLNGDAFTVQIIGFDYPAYAASYPTSKGNPAPALVGGAGQDDITISSAAGYTQPAGGPVTLSASRLRVPKSRIHR